MKRIPPESFSYYVSLGPGRSYAKVAEHFGVHRRSLVRFAKKHDWQRRLMAAEAKAQQRGDDAAVDALTEMSERHLKVCRAVQGKALEALRSMPLTSATAAVRALDMSLRNERLILGEPSERTSLTLEDAIKKEFHAWSTSDGNEQGDWDDDWASAEPDDATADPDPDGSS
jgi:transposase-like protein